MFSSKFGLKLRKVTRSETLEPLVKLLVKAYHLFNSNFYSFRSNQAKSGQPQKRPVISATIPDKNFIKDGIRVSISNCSWSHTVSLDWLPCGLILWLALNQYVRRSIKRRVAVLKTMIGIKRSSIKSAAVSWAGDWRTKTFMNIFDMHRVLMAWWRTSRQWNIRIRRWTNERQANTRKVFRQHRTKQLVGSRRTEIGL